MGKVYLLFGVHNHQPVGNFDSVIEQAYQTCYLPFFRVLRNFSVKCNVHFSGCLFDWLLEQKKEDLLGILKNLGAKKQIEFLSSGYYEPILSVIPRSDQLAQIHKMNLFIAKQFKQKPQGAWLTERIWQPDVPLVLSESDLRFTLVDDAHFRQCGFLDDEILGYYTTEESGRAVSVFPICKTLRYKVPFSTIPELAGLLKKFLRQDSDVLVTLVDDGEKFGMWPHTYDWVYTKKWLNDFFAFLEANQSWIETITFAEALEQFASSGIVYLPTGSYSEMMEWVLEYDQYLIYRNLSQKVKQEFPQAEPFVRGGFFKNFFHKYPRINDMHKKMMYLSDKIGSEADAKKDKSIFEYLWKAQCNCAYWHGVFGGFYLGHLRDAVYQNLIQAEALLHRKGKQDFFVEKKDVNLDGAEELMVRTRALHLVCSSLSGSITELSAPEFSINLLNTVTRRRENYHSHLFEKSGQASQGTPATIHDAPRAKEDGLEKLLIYDWYEKTACLDHIVERIDMRAFQEGRYFHSFANTFYDISWVHSQSALKVTCANACSFLSLKKDIKVFSAEPRIDFSYQVAAQKEFQDKKIAIEFNLFIPSIESAFYNAGGQNFSLKTENIFERVTKFMLVDEWRKIILKFSLENFSILVYPLYSVSSSESGYEKNYQQIAVYFIKDLGDKSFHFSLSLEKKGGVS